MPTPPGGPVMGFPKPPGTPVMGPPGSVAGTRSVANPPLKYKPPKGKAPVGGRGRITPKPMVKVKVRGSSGRPKVPTVKGY